MTIFTLKEGKITPVAILKGGKSLTLDEYAALTAPPAPAAAPAAPGVAPAAAPGTAAPAAPAPAAAAPVPAPAK
jgi:hypothetical protein